MEQPELTVDEQNQVAHAQALQRYRQVNRVFVETFGLPGKRTPHGQVILQELERFAGTRKLINARGLDGHTDVPETFRKHGRCDVIQAIHDLIEWKENPSP